MAKITIVVEDTEDGTVSLESTPDREAQNAESPTLAMFVAATMLKEASEKADDETVH